jgi:hypothetical protein
MSALLAPRWIAGLPLPAETVQVATGVMPVPCANRVARR